MGMFDSLMIEFKDKTYELQIKSFSSILSSYTIGDTIDGAILGSHTYIDELYLNSEGIQVYSDNYAERYHVFVSLSSTVFCEYKVIKWLEDEKEILKIINTMQEKWKDTHLLVSVMLDSLRRNAEKDRFILQKHNHISQMISYANNPIEASKFPRLLFLDEQIKENIDNGDLLNEIETELNTEFSDADAVYLDISEVTKYKL